MLPTRGSIRGRFASTPQSNRSSGCSKTRRASASSRRSRRRIRRGLQYREVLAALLLAGVRNIQPRPVGFKFHAVLVVNSAHLASLASPDSDRWLPIFWAIDQFKSSQAADVREGDWTLGPVDEAAVPPSHRARQAFIEAMDAWDEAAADAAIAGLARTAGADEIFELFARYGARDFRDIGHKAIYVANSFRTLEVDRLAARRAGAAVARLRAARPRRRQREPRPSRPARGPSVPRQPAGRYARSARTGSTARPSADATTEMLRALRDASPHGASARARAARIAARRRSRCSMRSSRRRRSC